MPGLGGHVHHGARRHVRICRETIYGEVPGGADWHTVPIYGDGMKLKGVSEPWQPDTNFGGFVDTQIAVMHKIEPTGDLVTLLWPEILQFLLDMGLERNAAAGDDFWSYALDHYTPADPRRYTGAVVERLTLAVTGTGDQEATLTLGLRAQDETENNTLVVGNFDYTGLGLVPFQHWQSEIRINSALSFDVEQYTLTVENEVAVGPFHRKAGVVHGVIVYAIAGRRRITLELTRVNRTEAFNDAIRAGTYVTFQSDFVHPLGHIFQVQLPRLVVPASDEDGTPSQVAKEAPRLIAIADAGGCAINYGVDLAAGGTTTLAPITTTPGPTTTQGPTTSTTTPGP